MAKAVKSTRKVDRIVFDIETEPFSEAYRSCRNDTERLRHVPKMRLACVYRQRTGKHEFYLPNQAPALIAALQRVDEIVSFNGPHFDILVLRKHHGAKGKFPINGSHVDLCEVVRLLTGFNVSLDALARLNLGRGKHTKGREMSDLDVEQLKVACKSDVDQTYQLWKLHSDGRLRVPPRRRPSPQSDAWTTPVSNTPKTCQRCKVSGMLREIEVDFEGYTDGQIESYDAGFWGRCECLSCKTSYYWGETLKF